MRWMPKRREARSCALKVPSATWAAHAAKADATAAGANTTCNLSVTMEPTALKTAATEVAATAKSTTTAVPGRPCYGTQRQGCDAKYQTNYLSYFHISYSIAPCLAPLRVREISESLF
jgi:hypothetical protein